MPTPNPPRPLKSIIRDLSDQDLKVILFAARTNLSQEIAQELTRRAGAL